MPAGRGRMWSGVGDGPLFGVGELERNKYVPWASSLCLRSLLSQLIPQHMVCLTERYFSYGESHFCCDRGS